MRGGGAPSLLAFLMRRRPASLPLPAAPPCATNTAAVLRATQACSLSVGGSCVSAFSFFCAVSRLARPPFGVLVLLCRLPYPFGCGLRPLVVCAPCSGAFFLFWRRRGLACLLCGPRLFSRVLLAPPFCGRFRGGSRVRRGGGAPSLLPVRNAPPPLLFPCARPLAAPLPRWVGIPALWVGVPALWVGICLFLWRLLSFCLLITFAVSCHIVSINIWLSAK